MIVNEIRSPIRSAIRSPIGPSVGGTTFALDATAAQIRAAILDPASYASGGWRLPGLAGARLSASARASVAMQQRVDGGWEFAPHNLLVQSASTTTTPWAAGGGGSATWPTGKLTTGSGSMTHAVSQPVSGIPIGVRHTMSGIFKAAELSTIRLDMSDQTTGDAYADFDLAAGTTGGGLASGSWTGASASIAALGGGEYQCALTAIRGAGTVSAPVYYLLSGGLQTFVGNGVNGVLARNPQLNLGPAPTAYIPTTTTAVYGPAIDWLSGIGAYGLRSEEARTNLLFPSVPAASTGLWSALTGVTLTGSQADPFGGSAATLMTATGASDIRVRATPTHAASTTYTWWAIVRRGTARWARLRPLAVATTGLPADDCAWFDLQNGVVGTRGTALTSSRIISEGAWYRIECTGTTPATVSLNFVDVGMSNADATVAATIGETMFVAHGQVELGAFATSPILTYNAAATRAADIPVIVTTASAIGTVVADFVRPTTYVANARVIGTNGAGDASIFEIAPSTAIINSWDNATTVFTANATSANVVQRAALSWDASNRSLALNGGTVATGTHGGTLGTVTQFVLGADDSGAASLNGGVTRVRFATRRFTNAELQAVSA